MRVFVDDLRVCPDGWTLARTNTEAIRLLATGYVDEISIDHDICVPNIEFVQESVKRRLKIGEETFQPVIYYIALMKSEYRPKKITIHTANPAAAVRMSGILFDAGIDSDIIESTQLFESINEKHDGNKIHCGCDCRGCLGLIPDTEACKISHENEFEGEF